MKSPGFEVEIPGLGMQPFRICLFPYIPQSNVKHQKGTNCFKKSKGRGRAELKCEANLSEDIPKLQVRFGVGDTTSDHKSDWVAHNFGQQSTCRLPGDEPWNFKSVAERNVFNVYAIVKQQD